jgi:hypothetical protein
MMVNCYNGGDTEKDAFGSGMKKSLRMNMIK